jgi:endoplasmic reticulum-Golgi intermediate compartment protein 3
MLEQASEGCNLSGHVEVNKVAGNFHFAPGKSFQQGGMHVHDLASYHSHGAYDFSHEVNLLSFGRTVNFVNPLDGHARKAEKGLFPFYHSYSIFLHAFQFNFYWGLH